MISGHGGNIYALARRLGCRPDEIIDMSSNVNPFGPPAGLLGYLKTRLDRLCALPEVDATGAIHAFAQRFHCDPENIVAANGTTQIIHRLPRLLKSARVLIAGPTYADYADACKAADVPVGYLTATAGNGFAPDLEALARLADEADTVFVCNPNNPTGALIDGQRLLELVCSRPATMFVVDESYMPFVPDAARHSLLASGAANLVVLSSMSKIFRLPGLRIGFAALPPRLATVLKQDLEPWSVNALAQAAVDYLMRHGTDVDDFIQRSCSILADQRRQLIRALSDVDDLHLFDSTTSFLLGRLAQPYTAPDLCRHLADQRILIRDCANFTGLSKRYFRISLKTAADNRRVADLIAGYIG